jgi:predicted secreted protein
MTPVAGIAIYLVVWWTVLFAVLPWGVKSQYEENGEFDGEGNDPGAPVRPLMVRKVLVTTVIASILWSAVAYVMIKKPIGFDQIPFMPKFQQWPGEDASGHATYLDDHKDKQPE